MKLSSLEQTCPEIYNIIKAEERRQKNGIELIASENYVSPAVLEAMGSVLTNKYSEGYPGKRYYGGNQVIDQAENFAIEWAKKLLVQSMLMFNLFLVAQLIWLFIWHFLNLETKFWVFP